MTPPKTPKPPSTDRRSGKDRRQKDAGLPVGRERRRNIEPRKPDVAEIEMTASQWSELGQTAGFAPTVPDPLAVPPKKGK